MGFFQSLFPFKFNQNRNSSLYQTQLYGHPQAIWVDVDGCQFDVYNNCPQLKTVIDRRASMYSNMKIKHIKNGEEVENSPYVSLLNKPNPLQSRNELLMQNKIGYLIWGNSFMNKLDAGDMARVLWSLPPSQIEINTTGKLYKQVAKEDIIKNYTLINSSADKLVFEPKEIWHSAMINPENPILGISPFVALQKPISNIIEGYQTRNVLLHNKGALGIFSNKSKDSDGAMPLKTKERERLEKELQRSYGTHSGQSKYIFSEAGLEWQSISYPTKELLLFEEETADFNVIIDHFGLNANLFSREKASTFNNLYEGIKLAYQDTIIPDAKDDLHEISEWLGMDTNIECLEPSYSHIPILSEDGTEKADKLLKLADASVKLQAAGYTPQEIKELIPIDELIEWV